MSYETSSFSGRVLFHPWALKSLFCPTYSKTIAVAVEPSDRLVDVLARQFGLWKRDGFSSFEPNMSSWTVYVAPSLARTICGLFAGLVAAPVGVFYHGSMVCKETLWGNGQDRQEKIQAHQRAFYSDSITFLVTGVFSWVISSLPAMQKKIRLSPLDFSQRLSLWRAQSPLVSLIYLTAAMVFSTWMINVPSHIGDQIQFSEGTEDGFRLSQRLHANFGLLGLDGRRLPYSSRDDFFSKEKGTGKVLTDQQTYTRSRLWELRASVETELLLTAIEAKRDIEVPFEYPINGEKVANLLDDYFDAEGQFASRLRRLQHAVSSMEDLLESLWAYRGKKIASKTLIPKSLYKTLFDSGKGAVGADRLRAMGVGSEGWVDKITFLTQYFQKNSNLDSEENPDVDLWQTLGAFHERWKQLSNIKGSYCKNTYLFTDFPNALEQKELLALYLSRNKDPKKLILEIVHSDRVQGLEPLGQKLRIAVEELEHCEALDKLNRCFLKLDLTKLAKTCDALTREHGACEDLKKKDVLMEQIYFLRMCQKCVTEGVPSSADLLPPFRDRYSFDGKYIEQLKGFFDGDADLLELLNFCEEEYLASKENRDQAWIENFFIEDNLKQLEKGREILALHENSYISDFAKGVENALNDRSQSGADTSCHHISYAHVLTGLSRSEDISYDALLNRYEALHASIQGALNLGLREALEFQGGQIILNFYNLVSSKVYDQLEKMASHPKPEPGPSSEMDID